MKGYPIVSFAGPDWRSVPNTRWKTSWLQSIHLESIENEMPATAPDIEIYDIFPIFDSMASEEQRIEVCLCKDCLIILPLDDHSRFWMF